MPSGRSPALLVSFSRVPLGFGPKQSRAWHLWSSSARCSEPRPHSRSLRRRSRRLRGDTRRNALSAKYRLLALRRVSPRIRRTASPHVAQFATRPLVPCLTFRYGAFLFVAFALAAVPPARLATSVHIRTKSPAFFAGFIPQPATTIKPWLFRAAAAAFCCRYVHQPHKRAPSDANLIRRRPVCCRLDPFDLYECITCRRCRGNNVVVGRSGHIHAYVRRTLNFANDLLQVCLCGGRIGEFSPYSSAEDGQSAPIDIYTCQSPAIRRNYAIRLKGKELATDRRDRFAAKAINGPHVNSERYAKRFRSVLSQRFPTIRCLDIGSIRLTQ